jgi:hypothetical protein
MNSMQALNDSHPFMAAWKKYVATAEYVNALKWAMAEVYDDGRVISDDNRKNHVEGALWLAFTKGMEMAAGRGQFKLPDELMGGAVKVIRPTDLRNRVGMYMMEERGVKMGRNVDPGDVQDMIEEFTRREIKSVAPSPAQGTPEPPQEEFTHLVNRGVASLYISAMAFAEHKISPDEFEQNARKWLEYVHKKGELAALAGPQNGQRWVRVEDRLPDESEMVVLFQRKGIASMTTFGIRDGKKWLDYSDTTDDYPNEILNITHWQLLPAAPTGDAPTEKL